MPDFDFSVLGTREHLSPRLLEHVRRRTAGRRAGEPRRDAAADGCGGGARGPRRRRLHRSGRAPPPRLRHLGARRRARRDRRADRADPARHRRHRAVLGRPHPGLPALRHPRRGASSVGAEVQLGRGSFIESFGLFPGSSCPTTTGSSPGAEKLDLFAALQDEGPVSWEGTVRPPLVDQRVYPTTAAGRLPAWIGVGGTPQSVVRAAQYGMPLMLAVIGGSPAGFVQLADLYREALGRMELPELPIGMHSPGSRGGHRRAGARAALPEPGRALHPHRTRARMAAVLPHPVRAGGLPGGRVVRRFPETVAQKIAWAALDPRPEPLPAEVLRRLAPARPAHGVGAPLRRGSHPRVREPPRAGAES